VGDVLSAIGPSLLIVLGGIISWVLKTKRDELQEIEKRLAERRTEAYLKALEPYYEMLSYKTGGKSDPAKGVERAIAVIQRADYWKSYFDLCLYAPDAVVKSFNNLFSYFYSLSRTGEMPEQAEKQSLRSLGLYSEVMLEIRKALGNPRSKLAAVEMIRGYIKDAPSKAKEMYPE
jgi:hypothetical protein